MLITKRKRLYFDIEGVNKYLFDIEVKSQLLLFIVNGDNDKDI